VTNQGSAIFVCCSRSDAISHARVLRSKLAMRIGRPCAIGGALTTTSLIYEANLFVVLLTKGLLSDPNALYEIFLAVEIGLPLVTVAINGAGYDYGEAAATFRDLEPSLERSAPGSASVLKGRLKYDMKRGVSIAEMSAKLQGSLTAIIALAWSPASENQLDAVVYDIVSRYPKNARAPKRTQNRGSLKNVVDSAKRCPAKIRLRVSRQRPPPQRQSRATLGV